MQVVNKTGVESVT